MRRSRLYAIVGALSLLSAVGGYREPCAACSSVLTTTETRGSTGLPNGTVDGDGGAGTRSTGFDVQGRGKKKTKNASMNMMVGGSVMAAFVVIFVLLNTITVTLGKALLFTFIAKFLVSVNWVSSGSSSNTKSNHKDVTVVMK